MEKPDSKERLVDFLDRRAFDPVLSAVPDEYEEGEQRTLRAVQERTRQEKERYHASCGSAQEVRDRFRSDLRSPEAGKTDRELRSLGLPTLSDLAEDFEKLCGKLKLGRRRSSA